MIVLDYIKRYGFMLLSWVVLVIAGVIVWQLYQGVYRPLLTKTDLTQPAAYTIPRGALTAALDRLDRKPLVVVDFTEVAGQITTPQTAVTPSSEVSSEGITVDEAAP